MERALSRALQDLHSAWMPPLTGCGQTTCPLVFVCLRVLPAVVVNGAQVRTRHRARWDMAEALHVSEQGAGMLAITGERIS